MSKAPFGSTRHPQTPHQLPYVCKQPSAELLSLELGLVSVSPHSARHCYQCYNTITHTMTQLQHKPSQLPTSPIPAPLLKTGPKRLPYESGSAFLASRPSRPISNASHRHACCECAVLSNPFRPFTKSSRNPHGTCCSNCSNVTRLQNSCQEPGDAANGQVGHRYP